MADYSDEIAKNFYLFERFGRGRLRSNHAVSIEPPFAQFFHVDRDRDTIDTTRHPFILERLFNWVTGLRSGKRESENITNEEYYNSFNLKSDFKRVEYCSFRIAPLSNKVNILSLEELSTSLLSTQYPVAFEIVATARSLDYQISCSLEDVKYVQPILIGLFGQSVTKWPDMAEKEIFFNPYHWAVRDLGLKYEYMLPLKSLDKNILDGFSPLVSILNSLSGSEVAMLQVRLQGLRSPWVPEILDAVTLPNGKPLFINAPEVTKLAEDKVKKPLGAVTACIVAISSTKRSANSLADMLVNSISQTTDSAHNQLVVLEDPRDTIELKQELIAERKSNYTGMILNVSEIGNICHPLIFNENFEKLCVNNTQESIPEELRVHSDMAVFSDMLGTPLMLPIAAMTKHTHLVGSSGSGKSTLILKLIESNVKNDVAFTVIDPHGDLAFDVLRFLPESVRNKTIFFDLADTEYPIGLNILSAESEPEKAVLSSDLVSLFKRQSTSWGDQMTAILSNAINALIETGGTLLDLRRLLSDQAFRTSLIPKIQDPMTAFFFKEEFGRMRKDAVMPILIRLDTLLRPKILRNVFAQKSGLDFSAILKNNMNLILRIPEGLVGAENSSILSGIVVSKIQQAAFARASTEYKSRSPHILYLDEFHLYSPDSLKGILSGARKFGLGLVLANQSLEQIEQSQAGLLNSVLTNCANRFIFKTGLQDAKRLEASLSDFDSKDIQGLKTGQAILRFDAGNSNFKVQVGLPQFHGYDPTDAIILHTREQYAEKRETVEKLVDEYYATSVHSSHTLPPAEKGREVKGVIEVPEVSNIKPPEEAVPVAEVSEEQIEIFIENREAVKKHSLHNYLKRRLKKSLEDRGLRVELEKSVPGGVIDAVVYKEHDSMAVEISVTNTPKYETDNIRKCIEAGFGRVVMTSEDERHLLLIKSNAEDTLTSEEFGRVTFCNLDQFIEMLDKEHIVNSPNSKRVRGYKVNVTIKR